MSTTLNEDVIGRVRSVVATALKVDLDPVGADDDLAEALGGRYDSLAALEAVTAVENEFGLEVDFVSDDVRHWFSTIGRMSGFVRERLEDRAALGGPR
ncbi:acyl carrier protein [Pseudonocardia sp. UM4_GMWB1]|jgi:acyl carrier protein|uniref:acyl carrier protein n=1 Tax=Pseudonocardia sp. UM4_GMWB1 TaxID=2212989 RepID=UPI00307F7FEA